MARPKIYHVTLTDEELKLIKSILRKKQTTKTVRSRCQILNAVCLSTITNTVKLYFSEGIGGIAALKRHVNFDHANRKLDGRAEAHLIEIACSPAPEGHARWTLRLLEEQAKIVLDTPIGKNAIGRA